MKRGILVIILIALLASVVTGAMWLHGRSAEVASPFKTAPVTRDTITQTITSSGTLEPEEVIDVGSQVTGIIASFGKDKAGNAVDYRSEVQAGKVLATIDTSVYQSEVDSTKAAYAQASASVVSSQADLVQLQAKLDQAQRDWDRAQKLGPSDALSQSSYDSYKAAYEVAKANVGVGDAAILSSKAAVSAAQANIDKAQRNLDYCIISSPVDGTIIDRRVNIGQTVVSNYSTSSLFLLAKDLRKMQIWASVNEADVGHIKPGQTVTFTVDAYAQRKFKGNVNQLRYNATMTNNVVTYTAVIDVSNDDMKLIPYMTANVSFEVMKSENALLVPNAALRYTPATASLLPGTSAPADDGDAASQPSGEKSGQHSKVATVYVVSGKYAKPISVTRGITNGVNTEVDGDELNEQSQVIVADVQLGDDSTGGAAASPFTPKMPGGRGGGKR